MGNYPKSIRRSIKGLLNITYIDLAPYDQSVDILFLDGLCMDSHWTLFYKVDVGFFNKESYVLLE